MASEQVISLAGKPVGLPDPFDESSPVDDLLNRARELSGHARQPDQHHFMKGMGVDSRTLGELAKAMLPTMAQWSALSDKVLHGEDMRELGPEAQ